MGFFPGCRSNREHFHFEHSPNLSKTDSLSTLELPQKSCTSNPVLRPCHAIILFSGPYRDFFSRDTGLASIELLISSNPSITHILLETSGLADPGNLAPLFWVDDGLGSNIYLDGIVTLVDARNILTSLEELPTEGENGGQHLTTAHMQISHADVLIVNKSDTVSPSDLEAVLERIGSINGLAKMHVTQYSQVPRLESFLLDIHAYDGVDTLENVSKAHSHIDPVRIALLPSGVENGREKSTEEKDDPLTTDRASPPSLSLFHSSRHPSSPHSNPGFASSSGKTHSSLLSTLYHPLLQHQSPILRPLRSQPSRFTAPKASSVPPTARQRCYRVYGRYSRL